MTDDNIDTTVEEPWIDKGPEPTEEGFKTPQDEEGSISIEMPANLAEAIMGMFSQKAVDYLLTRSREEGEQAGLHKQLAEGYESTGAEAEEIRELMRANYHQNEAILYIVSALMIRTDTP